MALSPRCKFRNIINLSDVFITRVDILGSDKFITFTQKDS